MIQTKASAASSTIRRGDNVRPPPICQRKASTSAASCASSIGFSSGSHGSGVAAPASNSETSHHSPSTANSTANRRPRQPSKRSPSGIDSQRQRNSANAATSNHGNATSATCQPSPKASTCSGSHDSNRLATSGHTSHQVNCAAAAVGLSPPSRRHSRLRMPSAA